MSEQNKKKFTETHEWAQLDQDGIVTVGISEHAQQALGDIVFVEVTQQGDVEKGQDVAVVESVKAASDIYAPIKGEIIEVNEALEGSPELINTDPYGAGWIYKLRPAAVEQLESLLDAQAYEAQTEA
ncbi:MAG: glycine cleavage system protein H [Legionellales bacterium]|nr:glycine cleavage system protein H [Legionellales bacterium]|tara:strand:- start:522 stop:902 length:381 start_codon:yes stop_codon:yes gene_type:complete